MRVSAVSHLGKGLARPRGAGPARSLQGRTRSAAGLLRLETALEEFVDQQFDMLALDLHHAVARDCRRCRSAASARWPAPERIAGERQATDGGHRLAAAALGLAAHARDPVADRRYGLPADAGVFGLLAVRAMPAAIRGIHQPAEGGQGRSFFDHRAFPQNGLDGPGQQRWPAGADRDAPLRQGLRRGGMGTARKGRAI